MMNQKEKSLLIQQWWENRINLVMLQEIMLIKDEKFYIKNYKIYCANTSRKGTSIIISNSLNCDTYKTIKDLF